MSKIFKLFVNAIFMIVIILLSAYFLLRVSDKIEIYNVKTGSMEEKIHVGDYILIYRKKNYEVGEVVTYTSNNGFITHRIIRKENGKVITKGDANNTEDNEILESTIVGKVIISGGILNVIINFKYIIVCVLLSLYLFSCYFDKEKKDETEIKLDDESKKQDELENNDSLEVIENNNDQELVKEEDTQEEIKEEKQEEIKENVDSLDEESLESEKDTNEKEVETVEEIEIVKKKNNSKKENKEKKKNK